MIKEGGFFIFLFIFISLALHLILAFNFSFYIQAHGAPSVYVWNDIIGQKDLFLQKKPIEFPPQAFSSQVSLSRNYFSKALPKEGYLYLAKETGGDIVHQAPKGFSDEELPFTERKGYFYLWEKEKYISSSDEEKVSYQAYISPQGRVIFLYPQNLPLDSSRGLNFQDYVREAALFLEPKFFWTKLEAVVK